MHETAARDLVLVRAIETTDAERALWSDAERAWASRAAAEIVTGTARDEDFLVRRALLAREELTHRHAALRRAVRVASWPAWVTPTLLAVAFVLSVSVDRIGSGGHVNILAPPVLALLAWNLVVYLLLAARSLQRMLGRRGARTGPIREWIVRATGSQPFTRRVAADAPVAAGIAAFVSAWSTLVGGLYAARVARILHVAAIVVAAGVLIGLYVRGLALEYRASWESTFLDAPQVHDLLRVVLAPGAWLTGIPVPSTEHIAALRSSVPGAGENAATWVHLYAATVTLVIIVPRLLLAIIASGIERRHQQRMPVRIGDPYYRRLLRAFREGPMRVRVVPYSFNPTPSAADALRALTLRAFGAAELTVAEAVPYGGEDSLAAGLVPASADLVLPLFNATATPETETHGAFLSSIAASGEHADCVAIVDESGFRQRWPGD